MPTTGGVSAGFERYGAGFPLIRRVYESLAAQMGSAYDQAWPPATPAAIEIYAIAKAFALDGYGATERLRNNLFPDKAQLITNMLQRWERILGAVVLPADTEPIRQSRCKALWLRDVVAATDQPMIDALQAALGPIYVGIVKQTLATELAIVNGIGNVVASGTAPPAMTCTGTPTEAEMLYVACTLGGPRGTAQFKWSINNGLTFTQTGQVTAANFPLLLAGNPLGLSLQFPAGTYTNDNTWSLLIAPLVPWYSSIAHIDVQVTQNVAGYANADGTPNALFYQTVGAIAPLLDDMLPATTTYDWFIQDSASANAFKLDEHNLDLEILT
jgi:hypothetical protein